jgi:hypothetical protein
MMPGAPGQGGPGEGPPPEALKVAARIGLGVLCPIIGE